MAARIPHARSNPTRPLESHTPAQALTVARTRPVESLPQTLRLLAGDLLPRRLCPMVTQAFPACAAAAAHRLRVYSSLVIRCVSVARPRVSERARVRE